MEKQNKALAQVAVKLLTNVSAIGIGLAVYQFKWWCIVVATAAASAAFSLAWRSAE
ncbi:MAG: hypothetical protein IK079_02935 [Desulfovibrio sp.]|nr:hypothetical protein [Desulfovibrio sp.]